MKKFFASKAVMFLLAFVLAVSLGLAIAWGAQPIPAPFDKGKAVAMRGGLNQEIMMYFWERQVNINGDQIFYGINYVPPDHPLFPEQIVLKKTQLGVIQAIAYIVEDKIFMFFTSETRTWVEIDSNDGFKVAFKFFRELVAYNLI